MCRFFLLLFILGICQLSMAQKISDASLSDDLGVRQKRISPLSLSRQMDILTSKKVKHNDIYTLNEELLNAIITDAPESLFLSITIGTSNVDLLLHNVNVMSSNYRLRTSSGIDRLLPDNVITYSGIVEGSAEKAVITISDGKLYMLVNTEEGAYEINPTREDTTYYGHYASSRITTSNWSCETQDDRGHNAPLLAGSRSGDCIEVYLECDFSTFQDNGSSVTDTETWTITMMNAVIALYDDINIPLVVSEIFIWDTADPYIGQSSLTSLRNSFMDEVQNNYNGRIAKLISTRSIGGGLSNGIGGLCGQYGDFPSPYAVVTNLDPKYDDFPMYSYNIYVIAHEIGHIIGARHTHACVWNGNNTQIDDCGNFYASNNGGTPEGLTCYDDTNPVIPVGGGTIMSNCNLIQAIGIDFSNGFHPLVAAEMQSSYTNADCATGVVCNTITPSNDNCIGAIELTAVDQCNPRIFDNYLATISGTAPSFECGDMNMLVDVWFRVIIPASGSITVETTNDGILSDMAIQTYTGDCNNLIRSVCDQNSGSGNHALATHSNLTPGDYLYIRVIDEGNDDEGTFGLCAYDASLPCHPDYDALMGIYNSSNGDFWTDNTGWLMGAAGTNCDICTWYGVVCDGFGRVKELNVNGNNLTGNLSASIADLVFLEKINLFNHGMTGMIPNVFTTLNDLRYLDLSNGAFSGPIPDFSGLQELEIIYLENNILTGELPSAIATLPAINIYWVKNNNLSGCIPANYSSLCNIQSVQMQDNESLPSDGDFLQFCEFGLGLDNDNDGFCSGIDTDDDCNDDRVTAYPGAPEICDGIDNNCNTIIDENFVATNTWIGGTAQWNVDGNWSLGHIPLLCEDVIITNGNVTLTTNNAVARSLEITNSGYIDLSGSLMIQGSDGSSFISHQGSVADISGSMEILSLNGNAASISGSITNTGTVMIWHPSGLLHMEVIGNGVWTNQGVGLISLLIID